MEERSRAESMLLLFRAQLSPPNNDFVFPHEQSPADGKPGKTISFPLHSFFHWKNLNRFFINRESKFALCCECASFCIQLGSHVLSTYSIIQDCLPLFSSRALHKGDLSLTMKDPPKQHPLLKYTFCSSFYSQLRHTCLYLGKIKQRVDWPSCSNFNLRFLREHVTRG